MNSPKAEAVLKFIYENIDERYEAAFKDYKYIAYLVNSTLDYADRYLVNPENIEEQFAIDEGLNPSEEEVKIQYLEYVACQASHNVLIDIPGDIYYMLANEQEPLEQEVREEIIDEFLNSNIRPYDDEELRLELEKTCRRYLLARLTPISVDLEFMKPDELTE
jgi:hypothetical protein